jgi:hypothetical protein
VTNIIVADLEADGLLEDATKVHCICMQELGTDKVYEITENFKENYLRAIKPGYTYVWHNALGYDFPLVDRLFGVSYSIAPDSIADTDCQIIDTLCMSRELFPDRPGRHGLKAWEERVTGHKPEVEDWKDQPLEVYLERCRADVELTGNVFEELMKEAEIEI